MWFVGNNNKNSPLRYVRQRIFLTLYGTLHSKNSKSLIYNIDYRCDVYLYMRGCKNIIKNVKKNKM